METNEMSNQPINEQTKESKVKEEYHLIHLAPSLHNDTAKIAKILYQSYKDEYCYPYGYFIQETGLSDEFVKTFIQALKKMGIVKTYKGLMDDDGRFVGSGFGVPSLEANNLLELALYRHKYCEYSFEDKMPESEQL